MKNKMWIVVSREYREYVTKKSFWIGMAFVPLFFAGIFALQFLSIKMSPQETKSLVIIDRSGQVAASVAEKLSAEKFKDGKPEFSLEIVPPAADSSAQYVALNKQVGNKELFGYLVIGQGLRPGVDFNLYMRNVNDRVERMVTSSLKETLIGYRLKADNIALTPDQLEELTKSVDLNTFKVSREGGATQKSWIGTYFAVLFFTMILMMQIMIWGIYALRSILEEKSSRVIEVLLSSVTPFQLMMGKIVGTCLVGLTQVSVYALVTILVRMYASAGMPAGIGREVATAFSPTTVLLFLVYFIIGFFFFVTMFTAVGSMVNSEREAQNLQQPIVMMLVIPFYVMFFFVNNPDSTIARVASLIPFFTPMLMMMRITALMPPAWEIALSIVLMIASTLGMIWVVSRIFRVGILMYGKRPSFPEIVKWVKAG